MKRVGLFIALMFLALTAGAIEYPFFPFYISSQKSHVMMNVTVIENTTWELKNGRSATIETSAESIYKALIVYPALGYYLESSSSLDVKIQTQVEADSFTFISTYRVLSASRLGQHYAISTLTNNSKEYSCAVQAPLDKPMHIRITLPVHLVNNVYINSQAMSSSVNEYTVAEGEVLKFNSSLPLQHVFIDSDNTTFATFCAETNTRYQLLPIDHCGDNFQILCETNKYYNSSCNISLTSTVNDNNLLTLKNSSGHKTQYFYSGYFFSLGLELGENLLLKSQNKICILLSKFRFQDKREWRRVDMISASNKKFTTIIAPSTDIHTASSSLEASDRIPNHTANLTTSIIPKYSTTDYSTTTPTSTERKTTIHSSIGQTTRIHGNMSQTADWGYSHSTPPDVSSHNTRTPVSQTLATFLAGLQQETKLSSKIQLTTHPVSKFQGTFNQDKGCFCSFSEYCIEFHQQLVYGQTLKSKIKNLKSSLSVNKTSLNSFIRQRRCAEDARLSSRNLGYVGVIVILLCSAFIVGLDVLTLCRVVSKP